MDKERNVLNALKRLHSHSEAVLNDVELNALRDPKVLSEKAFYEHVHEISYDIRNVLKRKLHVLTGNTFYRQDNSVSSKIAEGLKHEINCFVFQADFFSESHIDNAFKPLGLNIKKLSYSLTFPFLIVVLNAEKILVENMQYAFHDLLTAYKQSPRGKMRLLLTCDQKYFDIIDMHFLKKFDLGETKVTYL